MPWQQEAMKDAGACDKPRGAGKHATIRDVRMGKPGTVMRVTRKGANAGN
jgi:hypothetical protein